LKGGVLGKAVGSGGGSVQIRKLDGTIQEERTFPRAADPKGVTRLTRSAGERR
jgi:hypothetical protein